MRQLIFFIFPYHKIGGADKVHLEIIKMLPYKPIIFFDNLTDVDFCPEFDAFARCYKINSVRRKKAVYWFLLIRSFFFKTTIFSCNSFFFYELVAKLKNLTHNLDLTHAFSLPDLGIETFSLPVIPYLHKRVVINQRTFSNYQKLYQEAEIGIQFMERFEIIPNGLEICVFNQKAIKTRFENFTIGFVGRNSKEKRPEVFFDLSQKIASASAIAIGDDFSDFKQKFPNVYYLEGINDPAVIRSCFQNISVLILPSYREGFPMVVMEAMELGIPVIATPVGNVNGFVSPSPDINGFISFSMTVIQRLQKDLEYYVQISVAARAHAEQHFGLEKFRARYQELFKQR